MRYNEILLALYDVIIEVNKKKDNNYKKSKLFEDLKELLYLEKTCEDYYLKINELDAAEIKNFNSFAFLDGKKRREIKDSYKHAYLDGKIKDLFLEEYDNISDYIVAILLNELGDELFSYDFANLFNSKIKNIYTNNRVLNFFKEKSSYYNNLYNKDKNISKDFKLTLKEFQLLSDIYDKHNIYGIVIYNVLDENLLNTKNILSIIKKDLSNKDNFNSIDSIAELSLKIENNSSDLFSNNYGSIILDITDKNNLFHYVIKNSKNEFSGMIGIILNKLLDKKFLNSLLISGRHLNNNILNYILKEIHKRNFIVDHDSYEFSDILNYFDGVDDILEEVKNNKDNKKYGKIK